MKQKLALCCALIHRPTILFLDEPTTGVDTVSRKEFWEMLKRLKNQGITILVSTPYMDEAILCERIALIQNGEIMTINTPEKIIEQYPSKLYSIKSENMSRLLHDVKNFEGIGSCNSFGEYHHVSFQVDSKTEYKKLLTYLDGKNHKRIEFEITTPTIEDCFINLMH
jgi:ABC-type multidrug transport system ATPase subunit